MRVSYLWDSHGLQLNVLLICFFFFIIVFLLLFLLLLLSLLILIIIIIIIIIIYFIFIVDVSLLYFQQNLLKRMHKIEASGVLGRIFKTVS